VTLQHVSVELRQDATDAEVAFWELLGFEPSVQRDGGLARTVRALVG
jgi:hypothetical protein